MTRPALFTVAWLTAALLACGASRAASVQHWEPSTAEAWAAGTLEATAVDAEGRLRLGPAFSTVWGPDTGIVWDVASSGERAFVAASGPARVLRVGEGREAETWYEGDDVSLVTAVAASRNGVVFALSPGGEIHRAAEPGAAELLVATEARFVWTLLADPDGTLWIGTGSPGRLLRLVPGDTTAEVVFDAGDDPVRALARLPGGAIVAGTGEQGRVIRFSADGTAFVLFDADESEVASVAVAGDGTIFALAAGRSAEAARARPRKNDARAGDTVTVRAEAPSDDEEDNEERKTAQAAAARAQREGREGGALYRIDPDGGVARVWETTADTPYAVAVSGERVLVATGGGGKLLDLDRRGEGPLLMRFPSDDVSALAVGGDGRVFAAGTRDARVAILGPRPASAGSYTGEAIDAGGIADWGRLRWSAEVPKGAKLGLEVRAGNTDTPDATWSAWRALDTRSDEAAVELPPARRFQVRISMTRGAGDRSPVLRRLDLAYLPRNKPPEIGELTVQAFGVAWTKVPSSSQSRQGPAVADDPVARRAAQSLRPAGRAPRINKTYEAGVRTFNWEAVDPDGDKLVFELHIRREGSEDWFPLGRGVEDRFFSWDSRAMPDGLYRVRLVADDARDNPNGRHLTAIRTSALFRVDNSPPTLSEFDVRRDGDDYAITFVATDPRGRVEAVEYALDGENWKAVDPVDGVADSAEERFSIRVATDQARRANGHVMVRVTDVAGNLGGDMRALPGSE